MLRVQRNLRGGAWIAVMACLVAIFVSVPSGDDRAEAYTNADFDPGYIISDARFFDSNSMTEADIQTFLQIRVPSCVAANGVTCLRHYVESTTSRAASSSGQCQAYAGAAGEPASRIIYKVAQACGISPQVILATLQKERGLVTKTSPLAADYKVAMGYGCPDTAACDTQYYGFYNQVYRAAWQFREYTIHPSSWRYRIGTIPIQWHPNAACGAPNVIVRNQATANLYNYTPYQPNAAAMANLRGSGDACSSYGNRNFWVYFNDWFGSPTGPINPLGSVDIVSPAPGGIRIAGWALDPDSTESIYLHAYVDGVGTAILANRDRPDVGALYPNNGSAHGFDAVIPVATGGAHNLCIYGINIGPGTHSLLFCTTATAFAGSPIGSLDAAIGVEGGIFVGGWSLDPDTVSPIAVHVYVDQTGKALTANQPRTDIAAAYPAFGANHGFGETIPASPGSHSVCAYGINVNPGDHTLLGCRTVTVPGPATDLGRTPLGSLDAVIGGATAIYVGGWALDPDTTASIPVHVYVDDQGTVASADQQRSDVGAAYPGYGSAHGFSTTVAATPGTHRVCVYAINTGPGTHNALGCRTVTTPGEIGRAPSGVLDAVWATDTGFYVAGWALDPDSVFPISVHIYVDSAGYAFTADQSRPDIGAIFTAYGSQHGFSATVPAGPGAHQVCAYAIDSSGGPHTILGCRQVTR